MLKPHDPIRSKFRVQRLRLLILLGAILLVVRYGDAVSAQAPAAIPAKANSPNDSVADQGLEARAAVIYEIVHGALQVIHRDFFLEDGSRILPSQSLSDVFIEVEKQHGISIHWVTGNADEVNIEHRPRNEFEKAAVHAISSGKETHSMLTSDQLQFAGRVRLASQCLKCHVKQRKSLEDRFSVLSITLPRRQNILQSKSVE